MHIEQQTMKTTVVSASASKPSTTATDDRCTQHFTRAEAAAWINAAPAHTKFFAHVEMSQTAAKSEHVASALKLLSIPLSRKDALELVGKYLNDQTETMGRRIPCCIDPSFGFNLYWIG